MSCHTSLKTPTLTLMNSRLIFYLSLTESLLSDHMNRTDDGFWPTTTGADFIRYGCLYSLICASPIHLLLSELYSLQQSSPLTLGLVLQQSRESPVNQTFRKVTHAIWLPAAPTILYWQKKEAVFFTGPAVWRGRDLEHLLPVYLIHFQHPSIPKCNSLA